MLPRLHSRTRWVVGIFFFLPFLLFHPLWLQKKNGIKHAALNVFFSSFLATKRCEKKNSAISQDHQRVWEKGGRRVHDSFKKKKKKRSLWFRRHRCLMNLFCKKPKQTLWTSGATCAEMRHTFLGHIEKKSPMSTQPIIAPLEPHQRLSC